MKVRSKLSLLDIFAHFVIWVLVSVCTLGIGLLFWPYASCRLIINSIVIGDTGRFRCKLTASHNIGHLVLWAILIAVSVGTLLPFYIFSVARTSINASYFEEA